MLVEPALPCWSRWYLGISTGRVGDPPGMDKVLYWMFESVSTTTVGCLPCSLIDVFLEVDCENFLFAIGLKY